MTTKIALSALLICLAAFVQQPTAICAYDGANDLERSRDNLLDQRNHLQQEADQIGRQIDALQQRLSRINDALRDNDANLRDIERALHNR
jgi:septal ring factor EnvC (AmiA/AmiB activator)